MSISAVISMVSLFVAITTAWLTLFRRGRLMMTTPTTVYFGPDGSQNGPPRPKIYLRTLLFCTAKRGRIVESMFVRLKRGETTQNFNIWVYGDDSLSRGSGIFVGEDGVVCNHHFLLPADGTVFEFVPGVYDVEVFASLVGRKDRVSLFQTQLIVTSELAADLTDHNKGLYFDWGSDTRRYHAHTLLRPNSGDALASLSRAL